MKKAKLLNLDAMLDQAQGRMFREREPIVVAKFMDTVTVSTVFGPNSEFYREQANKRYLIKAK